MEAHDNFSCFCTESEGDHNGLASSDEHNALSDAACSICSTGTLDSQTNSLHSSRSLPSYIHHRANHTDDRRGLFQSKRWGNSYLGYLTQAKGRNQVNSNDVIAVMAREVGQVTTGNSMEKESANLRRKIHFYNRRVHTSFKIKITREVGRYLNKVW